MSAIKVETTVDEAAATAIPALRPLLGMRVELTAIQAQASPANSPGRKLTLEELLVQRVDAPPGAKPLTDEDIERAIVTGALDGNV